MVGATALFSLSQVLLVGTISYTRGTSAMVKQQSESQNRARRRVLVNKRIYIVGSVGKYVLIRACRYITT